MTVVLNYGASVPTKKVQTLAGFVENKGLEGIRIDILSESVVDDTFVTENEIQLKHASSYSEKRGYGDYYRIDNSKNVKTDIHGNSYSHIVSMNIHGETEQGATNYLEIELPTVSKSIQVDWDGYRLVQLDAQMLLFISNLYYFTNLIDDMSRVEKYRLIEYIKSTERTLNLSTYQVINSWCQWHREIQKGSEVVPDTHEPMIQLNYGEKKALSGYTIEMMCEQPEPIIVASNQDEYFNEKHKLDEEKLNRTKITLDVITVPLTLHTQTIDMSSVGIGQVPPTNIVDVKQEQRTLGTLAERMLVKAVKEESLQGNGTMVHSNFKVINTETKTLAHFELLYYKYEDVIEDIAVQNVDSVFKINLNGVPIGEMRHINLINNNRYPKQDIRLAGQLFEQSVVNYDQSDINFEHLLHGNVDYYENLTCRINLAPLNIVDIGYERRDSIHIGYTLEELQMLDSEYIRIIASNIKKE